MENIKHVSVRVPHDLYHSFKVRLASEEETITEVIRRLIREYIED